MDKSKVIKLLKILELPFGEMYGKDDIKRQYKKMAVKCHPDTSEYKDGEKFKTLNNAYQEIMHYLNENSVIGVREMNFKENTTSKKEKSKKSQSSDYSYWADFVDVSAYDLKDIEWFVPNSSNIAMFGYDEAEKYLYVQFKTNKNILYCYYSYQRGDFFELFNAESKGKFVYYKIIGKYKCVKMDVSGMQKDWCKNIKRV